ncbi:Peroxisomal membrane protein PEX13, partial [Galemys pyrenaicus]
DQDPVPLFNDFVDLGPTLLTRPEQPTLPECPQVFFQAGYDAYRNSFYGSYKPYSYGYNGLGYNHIHVDDLLPTIFVQKLKKAAESDKWLKGISLRRDYEEEDLLVESDGIVACLGAEDTVTKLSKILANILVLCCLLISLVVHTSSGNCCRSTIPTGQELKESQLLILWKNRKLSLNIFLLKWIKASDVPNSTGKMEINKISNIIH